MPSKKSVAGRKSTKRPTIGFLGATTPEIWGEFVRAFERRLRELGWQDGKTIAIYYRWAKGKPAAYASLAKAFVREGVDIIVTSGTGPTQAAKKATKKIPIVFAAAGDPVGTDLVKSLKRPGQNVTGQSNGQTELAGKRLGQLRKMVPGLKRLAIVGNLSSPNVPLEIAEIKKHARQLGITTTVHDSAQIHRIEPLIKKLHGEADAVFVCTEPSKTTYQKIVHRGAMSAGLPTIHAFRDYVEWGGLMSYGPDFRAMFGRAADLVDKILRGTKPADIPVKVQKKCELVVNKRTAGKLGLRIPKSVRGRAIVVG
jgi:putative ABC transport system substrate-binding protein